jgi:hypothetical protein
MSAKSIFEADGKAILNYHLTRAPVIKPTPLPASATHNPPPKLASLHFPADADVRGILDQAEATYPWLLVPGSKFVAKPDQLIKRRGKSGLLALNKTWAEAKEWIAERAGKPQRVETVDGVLRQFLVEPFVPHPDGTEYYININSVREVRSFPSLSANASFTSSISDRPWKVSAPSCACGQGCTEMQAKIGSDTRASCRFCFEAGRTKGITADPLLDCAYTYATRTSTFTCQIHHNSRPILKQPMVVGRGVAALFVLAIGDRTNHVPSLC